MLGFGVVIDNPYAGAGRIDLVFGYCDAVFDQDRLLSFGQNVLCGHADDKVRWTDVLRHRQRVADALGIVVQNCGGCGLAAVRHILRKKGAEVAARHWRAGGASDIPSVHHERAFHRADCQPICVLWRHELSFFENTVVNDVERGTNLHAAAFSTLAVQGAGRASDQDFGMLGVAEQLLQATQIEIDS